MAQVSTQPPRKFLLLIRIGRRDANGLIGQHSVHRCQGRPLQLIDGSGVQSVRKVRPIYRPTRLCAVMQFVFHENWQYS
jgi:hypothetical protein